MSVVAYVLGWLSGAGFRAFADEYGWEWHSAAEFRARHTANAMARMMRA
jgi:hypothetical protein